MSAATGCRQHFGSAARYTRPGTSQHNHDDQAAPPPSQRSNVLVRGPPRQIIADAQRLCPAGKTTDAHGGAHSGGVGRFSRDAHTAQSGCDGTGQYCLSCALALLGMSAGGCVSTGTGSDTWAAAAAGPHSICRAVDPQKLLWWTRVGKTTQQSPAEGRNTQLLSRCCNY